LQGILHKPVKTTELLNALNCCPNEIPSDNRPSEAPSPISQAVADSAPAKTILLAEDNSVNQKVALALLKKLGLRADVASNGLEALALLAKKDYALVLMDVQMPEMDGLEAAKRIREPGSGVKNPRIPIIAVTAHAVTGYKDSCLAAGMDDYLSKPIRVQQLKELLERWLNPLP
ncbi:MAG: response regulator, partial [Lentisphaeria bacterium]